MAISFHKFFGPLSMLVQVSCTYILMESKAVDGCKSEADSYHWAFTAYLGGSDLWRAVVLVRVIPPPSLSADHIPKPKWMRALRQLRLPQIHQSFS